ncbi:MAG: hypothetical protein SPL30_00985 [Succinivibrio sp.]|jgi:hypothetical protein|nr:hypothetical protein [Succinivibrio sp.]
MGNWLDDQAKEWKEKAKPQPRAPEKPKCTGLWGVFWILFDLAAAVWIIWSILGYLHIIDV